MRPVLTASLVGALAVGVAACGGSSSKSSSTTPAPTTQAATQTVPPSVPTQTAPPGAPTQTAPPSTPTGTGSAAATARQNAFNSCLSQQHVTVDKLFTDTGGQKEPILAATLGSGNTATVYFWFDSATAKRFANQDQQGQFKKRDVKYQNAEEIIFRTRASSADVAPIQTCLNQLGG